MKFVSALLLASMALVGINAKCVEKSNEGFFLLSATTKANAEQRCIENGGKLADVNKVNYNNAASAVAACTDAETANVDVWVKSWNGDPYNNVGILMNVNKESKGFTIHQYFESYTKRDGVFEVDENENEVAPAAAPTEVVEEEEPEPVKEKAPAPAPFEEPESEQFEEVDFVDDGVGTKYEVLCQVA